MPNLFIYSFLLLLTVVSIVIIFYNIFKNEISLRDILFMGIGLFLTSITYFTILHGYEIKNAIEIKIPTEIYSQYDYENDSILTDAILYNHLINMRVKHPKVIFAQAKLESASYTSDLYKRNSNLFGMKISQQRVTTPGHGRAGYKWYHTWKESVTDYILWQLTHNGEKMSREQYISFLDKIYAEDPNYIPKLEKIIKETNFKSLEW